jgi:hypothetical protein
MKICVFLFFLLNSIVFLAQKKVIKTIRTTANTIEINTLGLDDVVLENSTSNNVIEIQLYAENSDKQHIVFKEDKSVTNIQFQIDAGLYKEKVFRKFITKRIQSAYAIIKVPKNSKITIYGDHCNITSKSCKNSLAIYLEKGLVKLGILYKEFHLKMYAGTVYANNTNVTTEVVSNIGVINVNGKKYLKKYITNKKTTLPKATINTIKANIFLTTN